MVNLLTRVPRRSQPGVAALVRTIYQQLSPEEVHAQADRVVVQLREHFPQAAQMLEDALPDILGFTVCQPATLMYGNSPPLCTTEWWIPSLTPFEMRKAQTKAEVKPTSFAGRIGGSWSSRLGNVGGSKLGMEEMGALLVRWRMDEAEVRRRMYRAPTPGERERWHAVWLLTQSLPRA